MLGGSGKRGDHDEAIAIGGVHQGLRHRPTTSGAGHRQEQHRHMGELPAHLPLIRAEFTNHALIEIMQFLQTGRKRHTLPGTAEPMITIDFITALFCQVDEQMRTMPKHPEARLWPSEVVTLGLLHALKGVGNRAFSRWLTRDYRPLFPHLPERTRLLRLFRTHQDWTQVFLAAPTVLGVIDAYGIELIHPMREGRSPQQIGRKGRSNHRWIVGG